MQYGRTANYHRVYTLPDDRHPLLLDIHQRQIGTYVVHLPLMPGDPDDYFDEGSTCFSSVVDDFGNLRRVS